MSEYRVHLDIFAGPLDLLLYLVRKDEVDIYDIPISRITEQYIKYIEMLQSLDIDVAGEFLVMAAALMEIKSAMLLPKTEVVEEGSDGLTDPRRELVRQLLEYKRFKDAANLLEEQAETRSMRFVRPDAILSHIKPKTEPEVDLDQVSIWTLLEMFDHIMQQTGRYQSYDHIVDDTPIDLYQIEVLSRLQEEGPMTFETIFRGRENKLVMVGLFLGLLELIREGLIWAEQETDGQIYLKALTDVPAEEAVQNAILASREVEEARKAEQALREQHAEEALEAEIEPEVPVFGEADEAPEDNEPGVMEELAAIEELGEVETAEPGSKDEDVQEDAQDDVVDELLEETEEMPAEARESSKRGIPIVEIPDRWQAVKTDEEPVQDSTGQREFGE